MNDHVDELPETMTFAQFKERTAADLRKVATLIEAAALEAEDGNMAAIEHLLFDRLALWQQMLVIRFTHCREIVANDTGATT